MDFLGIYFINALIEIIFDVYRMLLLIKRGRCTMHNSRILDQLCENKYLYELDEFQNEEATSTVFDEEVNRFECAN